MKPAILIIDDSLTVRMDLSEALNLAGFATTLCATLEAARYALSRTPFVLMILDIILPDGDGIDFLSETRSQHSTAALPVILLSTVAEVSDRIRGLKTGADEYVGKPYDTSYVVARARELARKNISNRPLDNTTTVLVIDDSATFLEALKSALESAGYAVITAGTGEDGLRLAADMRPNAIIVDGVLPGMDGASVIRWIRLDTALRRTPCLLLTGSEGQGNEVIALDAGADAYLRKESDNGIVLARLAAVLRSAQTPSALESGSSLLGPKRILTVDDSSTYLQELATQLRQEGYEPILAHSGEEAIELLTAQPADCILLDLVMPGLSGQDTCRKIKSSATWRDIPLLMLTALDESEAMIAGINSGADDYITKSGDFAVLKARVRAQLRRKQFEDENRRIREQLRCKEIEAEQARAALQLAETRTVLLADLERKNKELESFSYSVSHDLRAPLRAIDGFTQAVIADFSAQLPEEGKEYLQRVCAATHRMGELIDDLLELCRVTRHDLHYKRVDLSLIANAICTDVRRSAPEREADFVIADGLIASGDRSLLQLVLENLIGNAWKYSGKKPRAKIEFGSTTINGVTEYFVRDDGAGFNMKYAAKLFGAFQRLHSEDEFPGTGIGLATVQRIIHRHRGEMRAEAAVDKGATFYFTLPERTTIGEETCAQK